MGHAFSYLGIVAIIAGGVLSMFPLWKSATLSPDSIERRVYWTGSLIGSALLFFSQLPDWRSGLFVSIMTSVAVFFIAGLWTNFIKINGRVYGAFSHNRPDRPPALQSDDE